MDLANKKFTITLPTLIGIISAISTIIGGYWYFKNTIESTKSSIESTKMEYKELKDEIEILREQLYSMAITYNKSIQIDNEIHSNRRRFTQNNTDEESIVSLSGKTRILQLKDTIDIKQIKTIKKPFNHK
jgi:cell shape-determining protein MreC